MSKKTNYSYIGIAFTILVFGIIFIPRIVDRISNNDISRQESRSDSKKELVSKTSNLVFITNNGENRKTITNKDYEGKVYVIEFFFTTCPTICPRMNRNLIQIQNEFKGFEDFGVASFTINPDSDTPEVLKAYAEKYGVTNPNWHLMTGDKEAIYKLSNEGFYIYAAANNDVEGGFEHSGNFALIDKNGFIRSRVVNGNPIIYYNGITSESEKTDEDGKLEEISAIKEDIKKLLSE